MSDEKPKSGWYTVAAVMSAVATVISAIAGLLAVLKQTGPSFE